MERERERGRERISIYYRIPSALPDYRDCTHITSFPASSTLCEWERSPGDSSDKDITSDRLQKIGIGLYLAEANIALDPDPSRHFACHKIGLKVELDRVAVCTMQSLEGPIERPVTATFGSV